VAEEETISAESGAIAPTMVSIVSIGTPAGQQSVGEVFGDEVDVVLLDAPTTVHVLHRPAFLLGAAGLFQ
jgi:hypothetical protein